MAEGGHSHFHVRGGSELLARRRRALWFALVLNGGYLLVELIAGLAFGSLALLADAAHMASDVGGLSIALIAFSLAARPASDKHSYGLRRAEVIGAQANAVLLLVAALWIALEAFRRVGEDTSIDGAGVVVVALIGLAVNLVSAVVLGRSAGANLNMRAAWWHMMSDVLGSVAALAAGAAVVLWDVTWVDLAASVAVAALVAGGAWSLLRQATRVLLEATPEGVDALAVAETLRADTDVEAVHHLHIWSLGSETAALSAHVVLNNVSDLHDAQGVVERLKHALSDRYDIDHATLEIECHDCETATSGAAPHAPTRAPSSPRHHA